MKNFKKCLTLMLCSIVFFSVSFPVSAKTKATMYAPDGRTISVNSDSVKDWEKVGWYRYPVVTMYAPDGRKIVVYKTDVSMWEKVGWSTDEKKVTIYAPDGRTAVIPANQLKDYLKVGWFENPVECNHNWQEATCSTPQTCTICGASKGEAQDHFYNTDNGKCDCGKQYKLYDGRGIKIYFHGVTHTDVGLKFNLEIINNSSKEERFQIWDGYVNGSKVDYIMVMPESVRPGESVFTDFSIWYCDLTKIGVYGFGVGNDFEFSFRLCNSDYLETPTIHIIS